MEMLIVAGVFILLCLWLHQRLRKMSVLNRNGIPGPKPNLIFGNVFEMRDLSPVERQKAWIRRYGKVVGCYSGANPIVLVADPDLARNIQIKDFNSFVDRPHGAMRFLYPGPRIEGCLIRSCGQKWKQMRSIMTPTFSASKLKTMSSMIEDSVNRFLNIIDSKSKTGEEFNVYELYQRLTTDVIVRTAFGVKTEVQNDTNDKFLKAAMKITETKLNKMLYLLINCFPGLEVIVYPLRRINEIIRYHMGWTPIRPLFDMSSNMIKLRKENPNLRRNDLLQVMLDLDVAKEDAMSDDKLTANYDENENVVSYGQQNGNKTNGNKRSLRLTEDEIKANCVLIYGAGYETTSTALAYVAHVLVNYPEVQEKVREEVRQLYKSEGKLDFNTVSKLQYMEWVLHETMRIYPPIITFVSRECLEDYHYNDITIPKGTCVAMATYYLHHDPDYWTEPEKFDPERFSPERRHEIHPASWQPFGSGPRNCVGMRFAFFEMKLSLAKLLLDYRLERGEKTEMGQLTTKCKLISLTPKYGVFVKAVKL